MQFVKDIFYVFLLILLDTEFYAIPFVVVVGSTNSSALDEDKHGVKRDNELVFSSEEKGTLVLTNYYGHHRQENGTARIAKMSSGLSTNLNESIESKTPTSTKTESGIRTKTADSPRKSDRNKGNDATDEKFSYAILPHNQKVQTKLKIFLQTLQNALVNSVNKPFQKNEKFNQEHLNHGHVKINQLPKKKLIALRKVLLVHPFKTWSLKHKFSSMTDIGIHEDKLQAVIKNARNMRLKQKLLKVLQGLDVYLDVIGGSNTAGGGIEKDEGGIQGVFYRVITDWWGKTITPLTGSKLRTRGIGISGTPSDFFQYCFRSYLHKEPDFVFLESAVNDMRKPIRIAPQEQLTRQLLVYPTEPALLYVNFFLGGTCNTTCSNLQDVGQNILTDIYNITALNWRDALCPGNGASRLKPCDLVAKDGSHNNQLVHAHISLMIINLFRGILRESLSSMMKNISVPVFHQTKSKRHAIALGIRRRDKQLPPPVFIDPDHLNTNPLCWTTLRPNFNKDLMNNLDVVVTRTAGFMMSKITKHRWNKKVKKCKNCRLDGHSSWVGDTVGAYSQLAFEIPGRISSKDFKSRSVVITVKSCGNCGTADVWLDNNYKVPIKTKDILSRARIWIIAFRVKPGEHTLNIKVVKKGEFRLVGVMLGPPNGPL